MRLDEVKEAFIISHLKRLGEYIDEMDLILLDLYNLWIDPLFEDRKLNEAESSEEQTLIQKFTKTNDLACKELELLDKALPNAKFNSKQKDVFEKALINVVSKYRSYNKDYKELSEAANVDKALESAHKGFLENVHKLDSKIKEYNNRKDTELLLDIVAANNKCKEKEKDDLQKKNESFEDDLKDLGLL